MGRLKLLLALISHYKYAITIVVGILLVGFVDENSFMHRVQLEMRISDLTDEIERYNAQNEADLKQLKELRRGPEAFKQIAREYDEDRRRGHIRIERRRKTSNKQQ